jgi:hypothetical protein
MKKIFAAFVLSFFFSINGYSQTVTLVLKDPDKQSPTNVRLKPGGEVITTIDSREELASVIVTAKEGNYFLVNSYSTCSSDEVRLKQPGYIHYSVLGIFISNYANVAIPVYTSSNKSGPVEKLKISDVFVNVLEYKNDMYYVFYKKMNKKFWIESKYLCNSTCTTCS